MSIRLSSEEFTRLIEQGRVKGVDGKSINTLSFPSNTPKTRGKKDKKDKSFNPQQVLFDAVQFVIPEAVAEATNLIPNRRFRADIYIPSSKTVIEIDGFEEHAHFKDNFHRTLDRQNLFVLHGYRVLRYYSKRIISEIDSVIDEILKLHNQSIINQ